MRIEGRATDIPCHRHAQSGRRGEVAKHTRGGGFPLRPSDADDPGPVKLVKGESNATHDRHTGGLEADHVGSIGRDARSLDDHVATGEEGHPTCVGGDDLVLPDCSRRMVVDHDDVVGQAGEACQSGASLEAGAEDAHPSTGEVSPAQWVAHSAPESWRRALEQDSAGGRAPPHGPARPGPYRRLGQVARWCGGGPRGILPRHRHTRRVGSRRSGRRALAAGRRAQAG